MVGMVLSAGHVEVTGQPRHNVNFGISSDYGEAVLLLQPFSVFVLLFANAHGHTHMFKVYSGKASANFAMALLRQWLLQHNYPL